jgi:hypothetical protein
MLKKIRLTNFKSFVNEEVRFAPLTLLAGTNASGKSNLFEAVRFLQGVALGMSLEDALDGRRRGGAVIWPGIRGGMRDAPRSGEPSFAVETTWLALEPSEVFERDAPGPRGAKELTHRLSCKVDGGAKLAFESLTAGDSGACLFETRGVEAERVRVAAMQEGGKGGEIETLLPADTAILNQLAHWTSRPAIMTPPAVAESMYWLRSAIEDSMFLELRPAAMRGYGKRGGSVGWEGENISGLLADVCGRAEDKRTLVDWLAKLCAPELQDIDFIENELRDVMLVFVEKGNKRIPARSLSDGTLRLLGLLLILRGAEPGSTFLIEEIAADLHPTRIRLLVEFLEQVTHDRGVQVIATTHSPVVLQSLSHEALRNVIAFARTAEHGGTILRHLGDLPRFDEIVKPENIGELFSSGWMKGTAQ